MATGVAISCRGLTKSFALVDRGSAWKIAFTDLSKLEHFTALEDVSIEVPKGQFVGVLGRNGAGKSTLLRTVGGIYPPDRGAASVDGHLSAIYELGMGANAHLTGRGYAERVLGMLGFSGARKRALIEDVLDFSELGERFDDCVYTYSSGMGARLYFSVATAGSYEVYLIDEVLSVGDEQFQQKCWRRVRERLAGGASGILVTHDWSAVLKLCTEAGILDHGKLVFFGAPELAVRRYLYGAEAAIPSNREAARFVDPIPPQIVLAPGEDLVAEFEVEVATSEPVYMNGSIEHLEIGVGWETILMTRSDMLIAEKPGRLRVAFRVGNLPLTPGKFVLNVGVFTLAPDNPERRIIADALGWLSGSGIPIEITGQSAPARLIGVGKWALA